MWGDVGRCGEMWGDVQRARAGHLSRLFELRHDARHHAERGDEGEAREHLRGAGDVGRCGEMWGDVGRDGESACVTPERSILKRLTDQFPTAQRRPGHCHGAVPGACSLEARSARRSPDEMAETNPLVRMSSRTIRVMSHSSRRVDTCTTAGASTRRLSTRRLSTRRLPARVHLPPSPLSLSPVSPLTARAWRGGAARHTAS